MSANIFDTDNVDDLPESIKKESIAIKKIIYQGTSENILKLFKIKSSLSVNEIIIGLYRAFGLTKTRSNLKVCLGNLVKQGKLEKVNSQIYKIKEVSNV